MVPDVLEGVTVSAMGVTSFPRIVGVLLNGAPSGAAETGSRPTR
ncbi:hypothetical protein HEK131_49430 [Streptomyces seoulensis]|nr:hypothetical protein HEK131_49430 [Streptomyces seoulensis]